MKNNTGNATCLERPPILNRPKRIRNCHFTVERPVKRRSQRVRRILLALTLASLRARVRQAGGLLQMVRVPIANWCDQRRAKRTKRLNLAVRDALNIARSEAERANYCVSRVLTAKRVDGNIYRARAIFTSKRSGGRREQLVFVRVGRAPLLGDGGPRVSVLGRDCAQGLSTLAQDSIGGTLMAGRETMRELGFVVSR